MMPLVDQTYQLMQRECIALGLIAQYDAMTTRELSAILGQPMKTLSDTTRDIDAIWVIEHGRRTVCNTNIQRVISPTRDMGFFTLAHEEVEMLRALAQELLDDAAVRYAGTEKLKQFQDRANEGLPILRSLFGSNPIYVAPKNSGDSGSNSFASSTNNSRN